MTNISITVKYFAILREQAGQSEEILALPASSLEQIYTDLAAHYGFTLPVSRIKAAINDTFCDMTFIPKAGDKIVFIPPVAGG